MIEKIATLKIQSLGLVLLGILFLPATLFFQPNLGGEGMSISHNITVWIAAVFVITAASLVILNKQRFSYPNIWLAISAIPISIIIIGFIVGNVLPTQWLFRQLYILGGLLFLIALFQFRFTNRNVEKVLLLLLVSGIIHGLYGTSQILWPGISPFIITPSREIPYSVFQQINLHASFQATVFLVGLYILSRPVSLRYNLCFAAVLLTSLFLSSFIIAYSGSRVGLLSAAAGLVILISCNWRYYLNRKKLSIAVFITIFSGMLLGSEGLERSTQKLNNISALETNNRINIYKISFELFKQQPLSGHGIGTFQKVWHDQKIDYLKRHPDAQLPSQRLSHPHNELIFWMVEGGLIAILGILISVVMIIYAAFRCGWRRGLNYIALLIPIGLHTQVELPFYISTIPWFLMLFLVFLILRHNSTTKHLSLSRSADLTAGYTTIFLSVGVILILLQTIQANHSIVHFTKGGTLKLSVLDPALKNPFFHDLAQVHLMRTLLLSDLNNQHGSFVPKFILWAKIYIEYTPIPQLYIDLSRAYLGMGQKEKSLETIKNGLARYPKNKAILKSFEVITKETL